MPDSAKDVLVVALFTLGPLLIVMMTSFVKVSVVLALVRNGLGTQDVPSGLVVTGMSLVLTLFIMAPVIEQVVDAVAPKPAATAPGSGSGGASGPAGLADRQWPEGSTQWMAAADRAAAPVRAFLSKHVHARDRATFVELASKLRGAPASDDDLAVLAPAFVTSELAEAFAIGFLLLLPFLVIDLVVGLSLGALGLTSTSPQSVSLPIKLLLFLAVDGWRLLVEGLVLGYT